MKRALSLTRSYDSEGAQVGHDVTSTLQLPPHVQRMQRVLKDAAAKRRSQLEMQQAGVRVDDDACLSHFPVVHATTLAHRMHMLCSCTPPKMHLMGTRCKDCGEYAFTPCDSASEAATAAAAAAVVSPLPPPQRLEQGQRPLTDAEVFAESDALIDAPVEAPRRADESEAARRKREESASKYTKILVNGTEGNPGIMRARNRAGQKIEPMEHQRRTVKAFSKRSTTSLASLTTRGCKTATALQCIAAEKLMLGRMPKVLISVPTAVIRQWEDAIAEWLRISSDRVLVTNQLKKVTSEALESHDVVVVTKDLVSKAYRTCFSKQEQHHTIQTAWGQRWVSDWDRIPTRRCTRCTVWRAQTRARSSAARRSWRSSVDSLPTCGGSTASPWAPPARTVSSTRTWWRSSARSRGARARWTRRTRRCTRPAPSRVAPRRASLTLSSATRPTFFATPTPRGRARRPRSRATPRRCSL